MKPYTPFKGWDCSCNMSKPSLYKFTYALILVHGHFTDSFHLGQSYSPQQNARNTVHFRIFLHEGTEEEFMRLAGVTIKEPPRVQVNITKEEPVL